MSRLTVHPSGTHVLRDGMFFPMIFDTAWAAIPDAGIEEWRYYVTSRRMQGFTGMLVQALPCLHDRSIRKESRVPFALDADGHYRFDQPNLDYFATARELVRIASEEGMVVCLAFLWVNYVPNTWGAERTPWAVMSDADRRAYVSLITKTFAEFDPVFVVSGDEHFTDPVAIATYVEVLDQVTREAPHCLTAVHSAPTADLPAVLADSPNLDIYGYQSGHDLATQHRCYDLATLYLNKPVRRPILNMEPAYEEFGIPPDTPARWLASDVRRAIWWSILAGAAAGIGYGAHGVWQWHARGNEFLTQSSVREPFPWQAAMHFPGANDVSLAGHLLGEHRLYDFKPNQAAILENPGEVRAATSADDRQIAVYAPYATALTLRRSGKHRQVAAWSLADRRPITARLRCEGNVHVEMIDVPGDTFMILERAD